MMVQRQRDGSVDAHALARQLRFGDGERVERAHLVRQHLRRLRPVQLRFVLLQLARVGHALARLRHRHRADAEPLQLQAVGQHLRAEDRQRVVQLAGGRLRLDRQRTPQQHRPGVQALLHLHQAHPGFGVAGLDRALDRRRAAPARQQARVHVPATVLRDVQDRLRQQHAVGHHHHQVRLQRAQRLARDAGLQRVQLQHRDPALQRLALDRRRREYPPAPRGPIRLGIDRHHLAGLHGGAQRRYGELGGAGEDDSHRGRG